MQTESKLACIVSKLEKRIGQSRVSEVNLFFKKRKENR